MRRLRLAALCALGLLLVSSGTALAQAPRDAAFSVLGLAPSARAAALAGSYGSAYGEDPAALYYNPALVNEAMDRQVAVHYTNHLLDVNAGALTVGYDLPGVGTLAGGIRFLSYGEFEEADENGVRSGETFGASDVALTVGASRVLPVLGGRLRAGVGATAILSSVADASASAAALDLGLAYVAAERGLTVSASLNQIGVVTSSLGETSDALPLDLRLSVSQRLAYLPLTLTVTGYNLTNFEGSEADGSSRSAFSELANHVAVGGELALGGAVALRAGYNPALGEQIQSGGRVNLAGLGLGFGINVSRFHFDYAYGSWSEVGGLHHLTLRAGL